MRWYLSAGTRMEIHMSETTIILKAGHSTARVEIDQETGQAPLKLSVPVAFLPDVLRRAVNQRMGDDEGTATPSRANLAGRITSPSEWRVNLFPDNLYALFE